MRYDWDEMAKNSGYRNERDMLRSAYSKHSLNQVAKELGVCGATIANRLKRSGITRRNRGGPNNEGKIAKKLRGLSLEDIISLGERGLVRERGVRLKQAIGYLKRNRML